MKEFGSDFHYIIPQGGGGYTLHDIFPYANYYADGRQALIHLYRTQGWTRLWVPEYFCYEVIITLRKAGLELCFYADYPGNVHDCKTLEAMQENGCFKENDAILRVNYFGIRSYRPVDKLNVPVVEDHTHDLIGNWATNSQADWCIASLRKSLPVPEGGLLWSPIGLQLPEAPEPVEENERIAAARWESMRLKTRYLKGENVEKNAFRVGLLSTEEYFDSAEVCALDSISMKYLSEFNLSSWYNRKKENLSILQNINKDGIYVLKPEDRSCMAFSLVMFFDSLAERDRVRQELIAQQIYPAILWNIPQCVTNEDVFQFSERMLSIHCDGRYSVEDIHGMKLIIESIL